MLKSLELNPLNINRFAFETSEKGDGSFNKVRYYIEGDVVSYESSDHSAMYADAQPRYNGLVISKWSYLGLLRRKQ